MKLGSLAAVMLAALIATILPTAASAQENDARKILKSMTDYVASQKNISATFDADIEVTTTALQKIQFTNSGHLLMTRPDKIRVSRTGAYADVELVFDGSTTTLLERYNNVYSVIKTPGSIDKLIHILRDEFNVTIPGADLLLVGAYSELIADVVEAKHIGQGVIDGVKCEHLAFRNPETDWQLWVEAGPHPIPRKYIITSKSLTSAPQYTLRVKTWKTDPSISADTFAFKAPANAKKLDFEDLQDIDIVPQGVLPGEKK